MQSIYQLKTRVVFNIDEFNLFESDLVDKCSEFKLVMLCGDANARTAEHCDFITFCAIS